MSPMVGTNPESIGWPSSSESLTVTLESLLNGGVYAAVHRLVLTLVKHCC